MSRRQMRWSMYLADFDYDITYIRGEDNMAADALSRMPDDTPNASFAACALAYTRSPSHSYTAALSILEIAADETLCKEIIAGYEDDEFAKQLEKDIRASSITGAQKENGLLYVGRRLLIPKIPHVCELFYHLAHDTLGHFGFDKSYEALRDSYYWPNMCRDLEQVYIPFCSPCQRNKSRTSKPTGPLHPLPVPDAHFDAVALDFIGPLPEEDGKDTILTMTNLLGAEIRFAAVHSSATAADIAVVLFDEWYCENGLMRQIISDRDALFTSELWAALHKLTGVKLKMSTSYHLETDGASERTNKTLNQAIRYHVDNNQKGWLSKLPRIRFTIMNTVNASTGFSPFQLKTGRSPRIIPPLVPEPADATPAEVDAREIIARLELDVKEAQDNLLTAKIRQAYHANEHRAPEKIYKPGDLVMLSTENRRRNYKRKGKKRVAKFMPRSDGPYTVIEAFPEKSEYTLRLPNNPNTFPGFHASLLKPFIPNDRHSSLTASSPARAPS
ncbi:putative retrotransposable element tf2 155 kda protein type 1-like [Lyophyllum shimeji]|uniref:Retrotransposable element tf2 155 kDa protein type 1-like n=1 Tax=Lyophyllum shimeji TaxID=47721 RepID=A0A9P3UHQ0_LYOSH|nr:putative retrotransposable element tf2 155 kda protein type 1-like [Lyophyllum shimeji]